MLILTHIIRLFCAKVKRNRPKSPKIAQIRRGTRERRGAQRRKKPPPRRGSGLILILLAITPGRQQPIFVGVAKKNRPLGGLKNGIEKPLSLWYTGGDETNQIPY